jgi:hypothetical protein
MPSSDLPRLIPIMKLTLPRNKGVERPSEVQCKEDLPERFFMGVLTEFESSDNGWVAIYRSDEDLDTSTTISLEDDQLTVRQVLDGREGEMLFLRGDLPWDAILRMSVGFPQPYVVAMEEAFSDLLMTTHFPTAGYSVCGLPDGHMIAVVVPIALSDFQETIQSIGPDSMTSLGSDFMGSMKCVLSSAEIVQLQNGETTQRAIDEFEREIVTKANCPLWKDARVVQQDELTFLTAWRLQYTLVTICPLRCVLRVVQHLHKEGLIKRRDSYKNSLSECSWGGWLTTPMAIGEGDGLTRNSEDGSVLVRLEPIPADIAVDFGEGEPEDIFRNAEECAEKIAEESKRLMHEWNETQENK